MPGRIDGKYPLTYRNFGAIFIALRGVSMRLLIAFVFAVLAVSPASAEELCPKYGKCVPADQFACQEVDRSSVVTRVCYNEAKAYMIIRLKKTDYHYCDVDPATVSDLLTSQSIGRFYNKHIKGSATDGRFDCRTHPVPTF